MSIARVRYLGIGEEASYGQQAAQLFYADTASGGYLAQLYGCHREGHIRKLD